MEDETNHVKVLPAEAHTGRAESEWDQIIFSLPFAGISACKIAVQWFHLEVYNIQQLILKEFVLRYIPFQCV